MDTDDDDTDTDEDMDMCHNGESSKDELKMTQSDSASIGYSYNIGNEYGWIDECENYRGNGRFYGDVESCSFYHVYLKDCLYQREQLDEWTKWHMQKIEIHFCNISYLSGGIEWLSYYIL